MILKRILAHPGRHDVFANTVAFLVGKWQVLPLFVEPGHFIGDDIQPADHVQCGALSFNVTFFSRVGGIAILYRRDRATSFFQGTNGAVSCSKSQCGILRRSELNPVR